MQVKTNNLEYAESLILDKDKVDNYYRFHRLYPFSNENTKACFEPFDLRKKRILSVLSSSDQIFEMFLKGARKIDTFDMNPLTEDYYYLKETSFQQLPQEEFLRFFCLKEFVSTFTDNNHAFNRENFQKIKPLLSTKTTLWNDLFTRYAPLEIRGENRLFTWDEEPVRVLKETLSYLEEDKYLYLKEHIQELEMNYINSNLMDIVKKLKKRYDLMYLSNIINHATSMFPQSTSEEFKRLILELATHLNPGGVIIVGYLYEIETEVDIPIYQKDYRNQVFKEKEFSYYYFPKIYDLKFHNPIKEHDAILIYTKK